MTPTVSRLATILIALAASRAHAAVSVIVPTVNSGINENAFDGQTFAFTVNGSGLTPAVGNGDSLASASAAVHAYGGYQQSFVTNDGAADYFDTGFGSTNQPSAIFDLGVDSFLSSIVLWQYQNDGGASFAVGNHTRTVTLQFNTSAQGTGSFSGPVTTLTMLPVTDGDGIPSNDLGGINSAQVFGLAGMARYARLTITDNYRGFQGITGGGDRAGLGELRFVGEAVPEPGTAALGVLAGFTLLRRRR